MVSHRILFLHGNVSILVVMLVFSLLSVFESRSLLLPLLVQILWWWWWWLLKFLCYSGNVDFKM